MRTIARKIPFSSLGVLSILLASCSSDDGSEATYSGTGGVLASGGTASPGIGGVTGTGASSASGGAGIGGAGTGGAGTGGVTSGSTSITIEEDSACRYDGSVEDEHSGFTGSGYINTLNAPNAMIAWSVEAGAGGEFTFEWVYSQLEGARGGDLVVNGVSVGAVPFEATGAWDAWGTYSAVVELAAGKNEILLVASTDDGLANIDSLTVSGAAVSIGSCDNKGASCEPSSLGFYQMEDLDRGVVAVQTGDGVYVGWRMMGYEYDRDTPSNVAYNLYKNGALLETVTDSTNYLDTSGAASDRYSVSAVIGGVECGQSDSVAVLAQNYIRIPLSSPGDYEANDASPGDLDGDGEYELVLKWQPYNSKDNSQKGVTSNSYLEGLKLDGTAMWRIDLGINIRSGAHYTQHSVYDFDGDGRAEVACKTAPGTKDGLGNYLSTGPAASDDDSADYRNSNGYVLSGPEYFTVFDGETGAELATIDFPVPRGSVSSWGDSYGNRVDRFTGGVSFVSDSGSAASGRPSIIHQRGYYTRLTISAMNFRDGSLSQLWVYDSNVDPGAAGQGNHTIMTIDADGDKAMELIPGSATIGSDGSFQCSTGAGHGDALHVGELVVGERPTVFMPHEDRPYGHDLHYADNCELVFTTSGDGDNGRGVAEYVSASNTTAASCNSGIGSVNCDTGSGSAPSPGRNFLIYWDGDALREVLDGNVISKPGTGGIFEAEGCSGNNTTKNTPTLTADLFGDWREELVLRESDNSALRVYTTTNITDIRIYTLMHDPTYRMQVSMEQASYNQPPHLPFHMGVGMQMPPVPDIFVR